MVKTAETNVKTLTLDHHGLVAAVCEELNIAERIDELLQVSEKRIVSPGTAVVAMIINGLGFTNRRLYLTPQFYENKPVERLLGKEIKAEDLTDHTLGNTLDDIAAYGSSRLFGEVAFAVALENNLLGSVNHLDTTSISVHGEYEKEEVGAICLTYGHSKDHRPDLKQAVLSLVVNGPSATPLWMESLNGNSSDRKSFHETIKKVKTFQQQIALDASFKWVADSALYSKDGLLKSNDHLWLCRVPETIKEAKELVRKPREKITWCSVDNGYQTAVFFSDYGEVRQRWLLVYSEQAYQREKKTLEKRLTKKDKELEKALWHLSNEVFSCEKEAYSALKKVQKKYALFTVKGEVFALNKHVKRGRPEAGKNKEVVGYQVKTTHIRNEDKIEYLLNTKGRFILATNDLDVENYSDKRILEEYKEQQKVEGGFRFLKDPWFMVSSIFLKKPSRIEALMMVMTLCLLVYNVAQYQLREKLKTQKETLPNQLGKEVQNPTLRWIFQIMEGICVVCFCRGGTRASPHEVISNLSKVRKKIIQLFGDTACRMYGVIPKNGSETLGM